MAEKYRGERKRGRRKEQGKGNEGWYTKSSYYYSYLQRRWWLLPLQGRVAAAAAAAPPSGQAVSRRPPRYWLLRVASCTASLVVFEAQKKRAKQSPKHFRNSVNAFFSSRFSLCLVFFHVFSFLILFLSSLFLLSYFCHVCLVSSFSGKSLILSFLACYFSAEISTFFPFFFLACGWWVYVVTPLFFLLQYSLSFLLISSSLLFLANSTLLFFLTFH